MSGDPERGPDDRPPEKPEETADTKRRDGVGQFAQYTAPTTLALLLGTQVASASPAPSDIRLKRDMTRVGWLPNGLGLYRYRYLFSDTPYDGIVAQEVASVCPDAVVRGEDGYLRVDYGRLGLRLQSWNEWVATA
jgi:hypothetical protein